MLDHADSRAIPCPDKGGDAGIEMTYLGKAVDEGFSGGWYDISL